VVEETNTASFTLVHVLTAAAAAAADWRAVSFHFAAGRE